MSRAWTRAQTEEVEFARQALTYWAACSARYRQHEAESKALGMRPILPLAKVRANVAFARRMLRSTLWAIIRGPNRKAVRSFEARS